MIQLKVYDSPAKTQQYWIDLYETEPIKLTLSIEDITNADATSTFSRAFKVPGTRKNAEFFKNSFDVDGTMFDVTVKKPAEILVDGAEFKQGHVRLQKIFVNTELDRIDYELLFLGETRDFSSKIGDAGLCALIMPDLIGGAGGGTFTGQDCVTSWQAYPESASLTAGLHNGNILYPLIDHGNTYDSGGNVEQARVALTGTDNITQGPATNIMKSMQYARMKPMIRAKRIWDQIFADAGYTYTSDFLESALFHQIYISAFGNNATIGWDIEASSVNSNNVAHGEISSSDIGPQPLPLNQIDPGGNLSSGIRSISGYGNVYCTTYTIPAPGEYTIEASCYWTGYQENSDYSSSPVTGYLSLYNVTTGATIYPGTGGSGYGSTLNWSQVFNTASTPNFNVGDEIVLIVDSQTGTDQSSVTDVVFDVLKAPGDFNPVSGLDCTYKQIDFVKDILTAFRLVLAPDPNKPQNFIIEPWQTYINSGDLYDWSHKLVEDKDVVIEPVFFSQSDVIDFKFQPGGDYTNVYHQQAYSEPYGWLQFDSGNDLLKGTREIKLLGIAPTEVLSIEGATETPVDNRSFILAQLHTHSSVDGNTQHLPIKPKTRMLFYNGLQPLPSNSEHWFLQDTAGNTGNGDWNVYPLVSPYQEWPIAPQTLNLNWANDVQYWGTIPNYNEKGSTLYTDYWSRYIESLYNKYSRRVTAYFILNNIDLNTFSFDDTIFVNGTYYRPERIIDVEVGNYTAVQVQLLTANDYRPQVIPNETLNDVVITATAGACGNQSGTIQVDTQGTPGFTWTLSNGMSGVGNAGAPPGFGPYTFYIYNVAPGTYTINITDSLGRTHESQVTVPAGSGSLPTVTQIIGNATICTGDCNGTIDITVSGGVAPYSLYWYNNGNTYPITGNNITMTGLCPTDYSYYIEDANGCLSASYLAPVECEAAGGTVWYFAKDLNCEALSSTFYKVFIPNGTTPQPGVDYVSLLPYEVAPVTGCFTPVMETTGTPDYYIDQYFVDCQACQGISYYYYSIAEYEPVGSCTQGSTLNQAIRSTAPIAIGTTVKLTNITSEFLSPKECYKIVYEFGYERPYDAEVATIYESCDACQGIAPEPSQCVDYTVANNDLVLDAYFNYTDCTDGLVKQAVVLHDSEVAVCSLTIPTRITGPEIIVTQNGLCI